MEEMRWREESFAIVFSYAHAHARVEFGAVFLVSQRPAQEAPSFHAGEDYAAAERQDRLSSVHHACPIEENMF
jgi:hypothetical protein